MIDDICRNNHGGNARSEEANIRNAPRRQNQRSRILAAAVALGAVGAIAEDLYRPLGICDNTGTARCSELKRDGQLVSTGRIGTTSTGSPADILMARGSQYRGRLKP